MPMAKNRHFPNGKLAFPKCQPRCNPCGCSNIALLQLRKHYFSIVWRWCADVQNHCFLTRKLTCLTRKVRATLCRGLCVPRVLALAGLIFVIVTFSNGKTMVFSHTHHHMLSPLREELEQRTKRCATPSFFHWFTYISQSMASMLVLLL